MLSRCLLNGASFLRSQGSMCYNPSSSIFAKTLLNARNSTFAKNTVPQINQKLRSGILQLYRSSTTSLPPAVPGVFADITPRAQKIVGTWLMTCAGMCFGAVAIGGITRLTESGLSMTQWHLIKGMKPPRSQDEWEAEFERYKTFPEFEFVHKDLTLEGFKNIFFWEYIHRMWGRTIGLVFAIPALYFLRKGYITKSMKPRLGIYAVLLLSQGLLGWYMVKSGLEEKPGPNDVPRVSQYRLCAHLSSAMVLFSLFLWQGLTHLLKPHQFPPATLAKVTKLGKLAHVTMALTFITASSGAFVAGLDAGLTYNTWPKMADKWIPDDLLAFAPTWRNFFENPTTVQFDHRHIAEFTALAILGTWAFSRRVTLPRRARLAVNLLAGMALVQVALGVTTLLHYAPVHLAASHQQGAIVLLSFALWLTHELRRIPK